MNTSATTKKFLIVSQPEGDKVSEFTTWEDAKAHRDELNEPKKIVGRSGRISFEDPFYIVERDA